MLKRLQRHGHVSSAVMSSVDAGAFAPRGQGLHTMSTSLGQAESRLHSEQMAAHVAELEKENEMLKRQVRWKEKRRKHICLCICVCIYFLLLTDVCVGCVQVQGLSGACAEQRQC